MNRIMWQKRALAQDAWMEIGSVSSSLTSGDATTTIPVFVGPWEGGGVDDNDFWAMMGNHMEEETTMYREEEGNSAFSIRD